MNHLIVFAKAPEPGAVKTRLARAIGAVAACEAYCELLHILGANLSGLEEVTVQCSPADGECLLREYFPSTWTFQPQRGIDLGERLHNAFDEAFTRGARRVVIIGSDCPYVTDHHINAAWSALNAFDVVYGPAADGGYWLIGARQLHPEILAGVPWGTSRVLERSLAAASRAGLCVCLLEQLRDIDTAEDWKRFCKEVPKEQNLT